MRRIVASLIALALAGCGAGSDETQGDEIEIGSAEVIALLKQSREAVEDGDLTDAADLLKEARALEPENPAVWVDIARLRFRNGKQIDALEAADRALELGPQYAPALLLRAQLVRDAHGLTYSLTWFEAAVEADPNDPTALAEYAATLGDAGYYKEMLGVTRALGEIAPKNPKVLYLKAVLAARGGNPVLAKSLLERSGLAREGVASARLLDAVIDLQERNYDSGAETLEALAQEQPSNSRISDLLARALWLSGRDAKLIERFEAAARHESASPYLVMLVGRALERQGDRAAAASFLERGYAGRPLGWVTLPADASLPEPTVRVRLLVANQRYRQAQREGVRLSRRFAGSSDVAALAGDTAQAIGAHETAIELYTKATRVRRPWPLTRKIAAAYRDAGDSAASDAVLARHLNGEPRNTEALLLYAERAARDEDWLRVAVLLDNAIELGAGNDPRLLKLRAIAARSLSDVEGAMSFERLTWELHPGILPQR